MSPSKGNGPPLTAIEKLPSLEPKYIEEWTQRLHDRDNPTRKRMIKFLCEAVFQSDPEDGASPKSLERDLLKLCLGNPALLCGLVRTPFLDQQRPLEWALICNLPADLVKPPPSSVELPPIMLILLKWSHEDLNSKEEFSRLYDTIFQACCLRNSDSLFQTFNLFAQATKEEPTFGYSMKHLKQTDYSFLISDFHVQMLTSGYVDLRVLFQGKIFSS